MIVVIDNYDSFTYNLVQYVGESGSHVVVYRNDETTADDIEKIGPEKIIISPGPGRPENSGICPEVISRFHQTIPILGVCLGHQVIGEVFGGDVVRALSLVHGKTSQIFHDSESIFKGIENPLTATRYHSLIVDRKSLPDCFTISAETDDGIIMGIRHKKHPVEGVQFHPESILTTEGKQLLLNFLLLKY